MSEGPQGPGEIPSDAEVKAQFPEWITRARRFVAPLAAAAGVAGVFAIVNGVAGSMKLSPTVSALVAMQLLAAALAGVTAALVHYRSRVVLEAVELAEFERERGEREADGPQSMFGGESSEDSGSIAEDSLSQFGRTTQPAVLVATGTAVIGIAGYALWHAAAQEASPVYFALGAANLVAAFLCLTGARWFSDQDAEALPESEAIGSILRATQWFSVLGALALFAHGLQLYVIDLWVGRVLLVFVLALTGEVYARAVLGFVGRRRDWRDIRAPVGLVLTESLFSGANPITSTVALIEKRLGVSVRSSYVLGYVRGVAPLIVLGMTGLFWATSALVCIQPEEAGVLTRFGKLPTHHWFGPGLHVKFPWPIDRVRKVPMRRVQTMIIGHETTTPLPYILWAKTHAEEEYKLVLGEGRELVSLDAVIYYRIKDPIKYLFRLQNPEQTLKALAYRVLMRETVDTNLDHVLSRDRAQFSAQFQHALQLDLDAQESGIRIVKMALRGIHPPVDVAQAYQAVVSAQIERVTLETRAEAERASAVPAAKAEKNTAIKKAGANAATRLANARGEAAKFEAVEAAYSVEPQLYRERLWLETLESAVAGKRIYLVDGAGTGAQENWIDLRPGASLP